MKKGSKKGERWGNKRAEELKKTVGGTTSSIGVENKVGDGAVKRRQGKTEGK